MHNALTRLELQGFKSFAGKTDFDLTARVVGVVGPNGSGKSNVIDAIRWVLGEREAKQLRGDVLGNLIFAGSPNKAPASLARVTLYFDNRTKLFPIDAGEIALTRRIDRSGTSQFFINDTETKLKDLVPMLAQARLGSRGLNIIGQGQSDVFVRINSAERREMIEELLGLKQYRLKKHTAERRLEKSRVNMQTVQAQLEELAPHLRFLRRQKNRWEQREEIAAELKERSSRYFGTEYHKLRAEHKAIEQTIHTLTETQKTQEHDIVVLEKTITSTKEQAPQREQLKQIYSDIRACEAERRELEREASRREATLQMAHRVPDQRESASGIEASVTAFLREIAAPFSSGNTASVMEVLTKWIPLLKKNTDRQTEETPQPVDLSKDAQLQKLRADITKKDEQLARLHETEDGLRTQEETQNEAFRERVMELEALKNTLRSTEHELQKHILTKERTQFAIRELENKWRNLQLKVEDLHALPAHSTRDEGDTEDRIERLHNKMIAIGDIDETLIAEATETEERHGFLTKELNDLETATQHLETLITDLDTKIHEDFAKHFQKVNQAFNEYFRLMFGGGKATLRLEKRSVQRTEEGDGVPEDAATESRTAGVDIQLSLPRKKTSNIEMLSGGEKSLVSLAALFALISVSPPPFLVLDEIDAALDEVNAQRFAELILEFAEKTQFIVVTHNRVTMETIDALYGVTMGDDGVSKVLSMKLEDAPQAA